MRPSIARTFVIVGGAVFLTALRWASIGVREPVVSEREITFRPIQVAKDGYVSSRTCKACHPAQYEAWHLSYHRTMTQLANPSTVRADFDGARVSGVQGKPMLLERRRHELWAEFDDPDAKDSRDASTRIKRQVVMVTGSHQQQVYWYRTGRSRVLGQLPGMYLMAERSWIPRRAAFLQPPDDPALSETGRWNAVCVECHATNGKGQLTGQLGSEPIETLAADTTVGEFGIACEACHGPSERHVDANRSALRRYWLHLTDRPDPTTVKPTRLNALQSSQVCGQCHGIWVPYDRLEQQTRRSLPKAYRPGNNLDTTHFVLQPTRNIDTPVMKRILESDPNSIADSFWPDGMVRVSGREYNGLIDSPCFKDAQDERRKLSCSSCHAMHKSREDRRSLAEWADSYQLSAARGNDACLQCHTTFRTALTSHTNHRPASAGSSCENCHMPYTSYGLLRAVRSHRISSPTVLASVRTGRPNACNLCHLDKTLEWTSELLEKWYGTPVIELDPDERSVVASLLWLLRGDAGQRALIAWSMGWQAAQETSGSAWMPPSLSILMNDPYAAVRFIASRSLRSLPGFTDFDYDFNAPPERRPAQIIRVMDVWRNSDLPFQSRNSPALLLADDGSMKRDVARLLQQRDHRRVELRE